MFFEKTLKFCPPFLLLIQGASLVPLLVAKSVGGFSSYSLSLKFGGGLVVAVPKTICITDSIETLYLDTSVHGISMHYVTGLPSDPSQSSY